MTRKEELLEIAVDKAKSAAEHGAAALEETVERLTPVLTSAAEKMAPMADDAWEAAKVAKRRAAGLAADTIERIQPTVTSALDRVAPAVDRAQQALQDELLPKMLEILRSAAATPAGREAREILAQLDERTDASVATLKTELVKTRKAAKARKSRKGKKLFTLAVVGAVVGAFALALRTFLGSREDWAAYEPDEPYVYPDDDYEIDEVLVETEVTSPPPAPEAPAAEAAEEVPPAPAPPVADTTPADAPDAPAFKTAAEIAAEAADEADIPSLGNTDLTESQPYGEGSYAGPNPPEGFTIKGNERSMKYHLPDAAGYTRTAGDVWFASEEAAQAAGFARAQR